MAHKPLPRKPRKRKLNGELAKPQPLKKARGIARKPQVKFDRAKQIEFCEVLKKTGIITLAAQSVAISTRKVYHARKEDEWFAERFRDAMEHATDRLEREARRRAFKGTLRPIYQGGIRVGYERQYSDRLMELLLRAHRPEKFAPNSHVQIDQSGEVVHTHRVEPGNVAQVMEVLQRAIPATQIPATVQVETVDVEAEVIDTEESHGAEAGTD